MSQNYQGIAHAALRNGGRPLCKNRNALICAAIDEFRTGNTERMCKRCAAKLQKMDEVKARSAERIAA